MVLGLMRHGVPVNKRLARVHRGCRVDLKQRRALSNWLRPIKIRMSADGDGEQFSGRNREIKFHHLPPIHM
jgi:hypothetical protein